MVGGTVAHPTVEPNQMSTLPPELAAFADLLDTQLAPMREAFNCCLCVLMAQAGKMRLVEKVTILEVAGPCLYS
jgi:hypothetical protein